MKRTVAVTGYTHVQNDIQQGGSVVLKGWGLVGNFALRKHPWLSALLVGALLIAMPWHAAAQGSAAQPRITAREDDSVLTTLRGNTHPLARAQYDQGAVADSQPMHRMLLLLQRGPDQEAALKALIDQQQSSASPNFHKWLTPQQIGQQFGPADADIQTVTDWLQSHGFQVARVSTSRTVIEFSGNAGQVRNAFHTEIHRYSVNGKQNFANNSDPQIPTALTPVVAGIVSLNNFPKKPASRKLGVFRKTKATGQVAPLYTIGPGNFCGSTSCNALGPGDFAAIYNVQQLWNTGISGHIIDGTGQTIAVVGDSEICTANSPEFSIPLSQGGCGGMDDVAQFRALFGLPANSPNVILDGPDPFLNLDETEGDLDVEWSGAVAKNATIDFVIAEDTETTFGTDLAAEYIVDNNLAPVLSESFSECEAGLGTEGSYFEATLWEQAAAQGITVVVAAGDSGSANCDDPSEPVAGNNVVGFSGAAVNGIASTPFNVAAGGTDFDITASNYQSTYWGGANSAANNYVSATRYIPETTWNDSCGQNFTLALACAGGTPTAGGIVAGGGGQSNCAAIDNAGNCYYYAKPSWQTAASGSGLTAANDLTRDLPDISLFAADGYVSNSFYVVCEADLDPGDAPCNLTKNDFFDFIGVGGTSSAAPTFAGMMALVNQEMAIVNPPPSPNPFPVGQGNANYVLYNLSSSQTESSCNSSTGPASSCTFNDITKGNNTVPCYGGTSDFGCSSATSSVYGVEETFNLITGALSGFPAWNTAPGLDLATGLGSVNAYNLVKNWPGAAGAFKPTTTTMCLQASTQPTSYSCATPITITHGQPVYVNIAVNGTGGTPIPVTETVPSAANGADPLTPNLAEDVTLVGSNTGGVYHFTSNDYALSSADVFGLINGEFSSATNLITPGFNSSGLPYSVYLTGGSYNVEAHYNGDGTYGGSYSAPISVVVNPEGSTTTVTVEPYGPTGTLLSTASPVPYGSFTYVRVDVVGASSSLQENATGTVALTDNGAPIVNPVGTPMLDYPLNTEGFLEDQTPYLAASTTPHSFKATFGGDASYTSSSGTASLTVTTAPTYTTVTPSATSVTSSQTVTLTAIVDTSSTVSGTIISGSSGLAPTGTVTFYNNGAKIGTVSGSNLVAMLDGNYFVEAQGVLNTTLSASGSITAVYSGDTNYTTSTSPGVSITVNTPGINLGPKSNTATMTISSPGQQSTQLITVTGANGFAGTVTLTAALTGEPAGAIDLPTCSFGPNTPNLNFTAPNTITLTAASETGTALMTCSSTAVTAKFQPSSRPSGRDWPFAALAVSLLFFFFLLGAPRQRRWGFAPLAVLIVIVAAAAVSCGGGGSAVVNGGGGTTNTGTTEGPYAITVTATPSAGTATTTIIALDVD